MQESSYILTSFSHFPFAVKAVNLLGFASPDRVTIATSSPRRYLEDEGLVGVPWICLETEGELMIGRKVLGWQVQQKTSPLGFSLKIDSCFDSSRELS